MLTASSERTSTPTSPRPERVLAIATLVLWLFSSRSLLGTPVPLAVDQPPVPPGVAVERDYTFEAAGHEKISYALYVPTSYRPATPAPLIVLLHGWGSTPWSVIHYLGITQEAEKRGYIVVAPYGYNAVGGYGNHGPGRTANWLLHTGQTSPPNLGELSEQDVLNVLALTRNAYSIDPKRVYLMGHSMGGGGTLYLGMKYPEQWAALAALSPAIYTDTGALAAIRGTPIMIVQGERDQLVKVENTRRWVAKMRELKMDYRYIEIKGGNHIFSIIANPLMIAQVFNFFDSHHR